MEVRDKIVEKAGELMLMYGIRTVTMDDISRDLGISKKTIYQYFKDKKDLVNTITALHLDIEKSRFESTELRSENSVHELILISQCLRESIKDMRMNVLNDLQKFYPEAWKMFENFKRNTMLCSITRVIIKGQEEGYFRKEIDPHLISIMRMEQVHTFIINQNLYPKEKYTLAEVQMQLFDHFVHGLFTPAGYQLFNQYTTAKLKSNETLS
ncbi:MULTISPECIES: TetR/AcrR family transcriptional regulator [Roseivirga]|jgi:AcrR family transcriptional regulator|uniref:TetR family transcriptional regulator n=1 Tax=Roseivirga thermotolerans TaxID=1758176 RepID=A0ABQ3I8F1_9BACT|nr:MULTISPECIES: TetR/AcrR family transcriptional regulator [Roseivirga]MEC7752477.1 TetR/AcrR family transcriptional regulator [Bacteroidota bacterium]GHE67636.1 TetR family transcriptional regulator [Roseivirga thermotolerans]|tara:strand:- start:10683 stop:11315 length:633 start_codon:yes stop_codon:yes gene_type:complete